VNTYTAVGIVEGSTDIYSDAHYIEALQLLIDTGLVWQLQGFFGRVAMMAIARGDCNPPPGYQLNERLKLESI